MSIAPYQQLLANLSAAISWMKDEVDASNARFYLKKVLDWKKNEIATQQLEDLIKDLEEKKQIRIKPFYVNKEKEINDHPKTTCRNTCGQ